MSETKKRKSLIKKKSFWLLLFFVFIIFVANSGNGDKVEKESAMKTSSEYDWPKAKVTEENIMKALSTQKPAEVSRKFNNFPESITEIRIVENAKEKDQKNVLVTYKADSVWDETDLVKRAGGTYVEAGSVLFNNPHIEDLLLFTQVEMIDEYGNSELKNVIKLTFNKETADKVEWNGLAERRLGDPGVVYRIANDYFVHLGILKNVDRNEVKLE